MALSRSEMGKVSFDDFVALDCEFVGTGEAGLDHSLARVSLVGLTSIGTIAVLYDTYVAVEEEIVDYRTWISGIRPHDLLGAPSFKAVRERVSRLIEGRILIGHAVYNDLQVLQLSHPGSEVRDTQCFGPIQQLLATCLPSLRNIVRVLLFGDMDFQAGEHSSVQDAYMTMRVYLLFAAAWEKSCGSRWQVLFPYAPRPRSTRPPYENDRSLSFPAVTRDVPPPKAKETTTRRPSYSSIASSTLPPSPPLSPRSPRIVRERERGGLPGAPSSLLLNMPITPPSTPPRPPIDVDIPSPSPTPSSSSDEKKSRRKRRGHHRSSPAAKVVGMVAA